MAEKEMESISVTKRAKIMFYVDRLNLKNLMISILKNIIRLNYKLVCCFLISVW
jgi:hypothetical protein